MKISSKKMNIKKKNKFKAGFLIMALGSLFMISSCAKLLEEKVDNRSLIEDLNDMEKLLNSLHPYADYLFTDLMSDDYNFRDLSGHIVESAAQALLPIYELAITRTSLPASQLETLSGYNPTTAFRRYYFGINNALLLIKRLSAFQPKTETDVARKKMILGKALAIKAYSYFMLLNLFAKQYDPSTAATDKGVPFIKEYYADPVVPFAIGTVKEIYDQIESDLLKALDLLPDSETTNAKFTFTKESLMAFLSKVYLNKKDWDNAIKYADMLLVLRNQPLDVIGLRNSIADFAQFSSAYFNPGNESYILMSNNTYQLSAYFYSGMYADPFRQFLLSNDADPNNDYFIITSALFNDWLPQKLMLFQNISTRNGNFPLFTVDETMFNRMEAYIEKTGNIGAAKANLDTLINRMTFSDEERMNRHEAALTLPNKDSALHFILDLKRLRFSSEGMRWFDMRRHRLPVTHKGRSGTYTIDGTDPQAYVIQMPLEELTRNPGAVSNTPPDKK